jgi:hypothetical protein
LFFGVVDVLKLMHEKVVESFDILGENAHGLLSSNDVLFVASFELVATST